MDCLLNLRSIMAENNNKNNKKDQLNVLGAVLDLARKQQESSLNPYQQGVLKGLQKSGEEQTLEALKQGVPSEHILEQSGIQKQAQEIAAPAKSILGRLLESTGAGQVFEGQKLENLSKAQKIISGNDSIYEEDRKLEVELKKAQLKQLNDTGTPATEDELFANIPEEQKEDYFVKPIQQTIRGIKTTVPIIERKKTLPSKELNDLGELESTTQGLSEIVDILQKKGLQMGPGFSTTRGAISDMLAQTKGPEFAALKAKIGRSFQQYRKWATGVAAGYSELNLLGPNYIKPTDTNEILIQKALDIAGENERNREALLNNFSNGGYAVSKLRNKKKSQINSNSTDWDQSKESRYQELLRKRGQ